MTPLRMYMRVLVAALFLAFAAQAGAQAARPLLPTLEVLVCKECRMRAAVLRMIRRTYAEAAEYEGYGLDETRSATLTVTEYAERDASAASLLGPLAGRDYLRGTLRLEGKEAVVEDSVTSTFGDIMVVAENIGLACQKQLARMLREGAAAR